MKLTHYFYSSALLCRRQSSCSMSSGQNSSGWRNSVLLWAGPLGVGVRPSSQIVWRTHRFLRPAGSNQHGQIWPSRPVMRGNEWWMTASPPQLLIACNCSLMVWCVGDDAPSFPRVQSQWGNPGPVWKHHGLCKWHVTDGWLPKELHKLSLSFSQFCKTSFCY